MLWEHGAPWITKFLCLTRKRVPHSPPVVDLPSHKEDRILGGSNTELSEVTERSTSPGQVGRTLSVPTGAPAHAPNPLSFCSRILDSLCGDRAG